MNEVTIFLNYRKIVHHKLPKNAKLIGEAKGFTTNKGIKKKYTDKFYIL